MMSPPRRSLVLRQFKRSAVHGQRLRGPMLRIILTAPIGIPTRLEHWQQENGFLTSAFILT
jgi:hypothetical protein